MSETGTFRGDTIEVRIRTLDWLAANGISAVETLPFLDSQIAFRSGAEASGRLLCLYLTALRAVVDSKDSYMGWLAEHRLLNTVTPRELDIIEGRASDQGFANSCVESAWALAWAISLYPSFDALAFVCPDDLVDHAPRIWVTAEVQSLRARATLRPSELLVQELDKAYCLHWASAEAGMRGERAPGGVPPYAVEARRRSFEWLVSDDPWDDVFMDT